jgi:hypothetical protein
MRKMHLFSSSWDDEELSFFSSLGIVFPEDGWGRVEVPDDDRYERFCHFFAEKGRPLKDYVFFEYTKEELLAAPYCVIEPFHTSGYPKPEGSYLTKTYDLRDMCQTCQVGKVQKDSFRVGKLSKHGFWGYTSWEFDVRFVSDDVYEKVFAPYGIPRLPVKRANAIVEGVSQLMIPTTEEALDLYPYQYEICPDCGSKRYLPGENVHHPYFPLHKHPLPGIYMTREVFGQGWEVMHMILASKDVVKKLLDLKEIVIPRLIPCTTDIEQYWGPKSDYDIEKLRYVESPEVTRFIQTLQAGGK